MSEKTDKQSGPVAAQPKKRTKLVRNRSGHKVELVLDGNVVVFLPGKVVEVPFDFDIPSGIGLYVK